MEEIGGYIELDKYSLPLLHENAVALNCGRNALAYLIRAKGIKKILLPKFICSSVTEVCRRENVSVRFYRIHTDFLPHPETQPRDDEWFYFINYYGQTENNVISGYAERFGRIIVDSAQSYFQPPLPGTDTLYSCRKYFGVADGAFLYTDAKPDTGLPVDESFERMRFLLGRFERSAPEFYGEYVENNRRFASESIKTMSRLTANLLRAIDYPAVEEIRRNNFGFLHKALKGVNALELRRTGTFMYPLYLENGAEIRKKLQEKKIYVPTLWPEVFELCEKNETEYKMAENILPLPVDQRYGVAEMEKMTEEIFKCIS